MASAAPSYLSKSKKDFKPKAPLRRPAPAATGSNQASIRGSADRQLHSQTPQPQVIKSSDVLVPVAQIEDSSTLLRARVISATASISLDVGNTQSTREPAFPSQVFSRPESPSNSGLYRPDRPAVPRTSSPRVESQRGETAFSIATPRRRRAVTPVPDSSILSLQPISIVRAERPFDSIQAIPRSSSRLVSPPVTRTQDEHPSWPAPKRRRVNPPNEENTTAAVTKSTETHSGAAISNPTPPASAVAIQNANTSVESPAKLQKARKKRQSSKGNSKGKRSVKEIADAIVADAMGEGVKHTQRTARGKRGRKSKQRDITPEEAENFEIEPAVVHMADLCASSNTGKKSTREAKLQERDMAKAARKREDAQRAVQEIIENPQSPTEADAVQPPPAPIEQTEPVSASRHVPTLQLINGQLMVNEDSRVIDRHANAEATREPQEEQVEDELTRHVNSGSYLKREARGKWTEELNERFYDGLRMFGTDFEMISKMFPGRTRHKIKLKFVREERKDKERIKELLLKERMPVDLAAFEKMSNTTYKDPRELDREMAEDRKRLEEEQAREKESMDEVIRQRAAEAAAESAAAGGNSSAKENEFQDGEAAKKGYRRKKSSDVTTQKGRKSKAKTSKGLKPGGIVLEEAAF